MKIYLIIVITLSSFVMFGQSQTVKVQSDESGMTLMVNGKAFMVNGMNWDYFPIGTNYSYSLWNQPEDLIKAALDNEMSYLRNMGVNHVRMYTGVLAKWIQYIYETHGIYTMLNHSFGRYGLTINGAWMANTEYSDPRGNELLLSETTPAGSRLQEYPGSTVVCVG